MPRLESLIAQTSTTQTPKVYVVDFMRIIKMDETVRKNYKQSFQDDFSQITGIPTLNPPTNSLEDADKNSIKENFIYKNYNLSGFFWKKKCPAGGLISSSKCCQQKLQCRQSKGL